LFKDREESRLHEHGWSSLKKYFFPPASAGGPIPIFNHNQGNIMQTDAELVAAQNDVRRMELELRDRLSVAFRRYANARQKVDAIPVITIKSIV
jgi:outer membrane protein TolC